LSEFLGSVRTDFGSVSQSDSGGDTRTTAANRQIAITGYTTTDYPGAD
jgi:hypothetical protein